MNNTIRNEERIKFTLRELYGRYGYSRYTMSKFEEYDLYVRNKDFLISDSVITFTDTNGRLMALKPDVTLSIVKNGKDVPGQVQKLYYDENVYRVSRGTHAFKEIMQVGLECIGDIDDYCIFEVLNLAVESLMGVSEECVLNVSHLGVISALLDGINEDVRFDILRCIGERNLHELKKVCASAGMDAEVAGKIESVMQCYGRPVDALPKLNAAIGETEALKQLEVLMQAFRGTEAEDKLRIDFSVMSDMNYYNGIAFKGFVAGAPESVLSGGQYDRLMRKMNRKSGAVGFAVYLDQLERLQEKGDGYDADVLLVYDETADFASLKRRISELNAQGLSVTAQKNCDCALRVRRKARLNNGEVEFLEENA